MLVTQQQQRHRSIFNRQETEALESYSKQQYFLSQVGDGVKSFRTLQLVHHRVRVLLLFISTRVFGDDVAAAAEAAANVRWDVLNPISIYSE